MMSLPPARRFDWSNLGIRVASATVLVPAVLGAVWFADYPGFSWLFLVLVAVAVALLAIEWGAMTAPYAPVRVSTALTVAILAGAFLAHDGRMPLAWSAVAVGAAAAALVARGVAERPTNAAFGAIYLAIPVICLVWLRSMPEGRQWTVLLFVVAWSADIAAFAVGSALKGPKLWPRFSPNKTWSGFIGGLLAAAGAGVAMAAFSDIVLSLQAGALIGLVGGLATMAGDLWESMLKRRFGVKDSGDLIPGHGGLLDRVDGLMFAAVVLAGARLINHWGWAN
ncbi:MAG: phosphatidate cytidylyltransferase [Pseudomonadota bacterium]|uniref:phosphatidate cytidylyltransferase n=1 Tax=unclassified Phenylobacterium TaxID=2640670 RepID=UPI0006FFFECD|nr:MULTISPECIES: phosphatidate cytidylyltransferase [unclassified Phenylobacterium]KRB44778.1 phosphatidate cytidylyltransferase [Phenylobacterium sp. Root700]MBT9473097.1 phosphatidate cytidylyltransferase [Phenylobacterium sp.]